MKNQAFRKISAYLVLYSLVLIAVPASFAQAPAAANYAAALASIEEKVEARRKALGIPGMSLAIVKDDKVIYSKGLGFKDFENKVPATADTQFAIGSATKAFTALSVLMTADEGKISLDASPRTVLPYFKMADPETDKNMTIRDLLTHSSGLNRTDIAMITGKLSRQQLIQVAGTAKPIGKLREKFGYQNLMYAAAGEVVAVAQKQPWEEFVPKRILKPLGMTNSNMSMREMAKAADRSLGYNYNFDTKETIQLPYRDIDQVAPAGSINSSANDMAKWLRFVLAGGELDGKRLISESIFAEWMKPQMKVNPNGTVQYALGWFVQKWKDHKVVQHGGNIDGFNAMVAMIPEEKLGFVMLTNVSGSPLGNELMPIIFEGILGGGKPAPVDNSSAVEVAAENEAGKYRLAEANVVMDVRFADGKLTASLPGQPTFTLEKVAGRKYKLVGAPDGFFITFRGKELYLEQPHGNYTLPRVDTPAATPVIGPSSAKELVGKYTSESSGRLGEVREENGSVVFVVGTQQPVTLTEKAKDQYWMKPLPDEYFLSVKRTADGKVEKLGVNQPEGEFFFKPGAPKPPMSADDLMAKVLEASGGADNIRKITSRVTTVDVDMEQQGVKAVATVWSKAPNKTATETKFTAVGVDIASGWEYFDGTSSEQAYTFAPVTKVTGSRIDDLKIASDLHLLLDWKPKFKKVEVTRTAKCGEEECYVVEFEPNAGSKFTDYYSTKTFLLKRRESVITSSTSSVTTPLVNTFEDYREVDGVMIPFKSTSNTTGNGNVVTVVKSIKHNVPIEDSFFAPRTIK